MVTKTYTVLCNGERHQVVLGRHGVCFGCHDSDEVWNERRRALALSSLSGAAPDRPIGCFELAALVRERRYTVPVSRNGGARQLLASLRGVQAFRAVAKRAREKRAGGQG